jgi:hypothetical protein
MRPLRSLPTSGAIREIRKRLDSQIAKNSHRVTVLTLPCSAHLSGVCQSANPAEHRRADTSAPFPVLGRPKLGGEHRGFRHQESPMPVRDSRRMSMIRRSMKFSSPHQEGQAQHLIPTPSPVDVKRFIVRGKLSKICQARGGDMERHSLGRISRWDEVPGGMRFPEGGS